MILRELHLRRIFLGRVLVWRRPIDAHGGDYFHRHPVPHFVQHARRNKILHLRRVVRSDEVTRLDACFPRQAQGRQRQQCNTSGDDRFAKPQHLQLHSNLRKSTQPFSPLARYRYPASGSFSRTPNSATNNATLRKVNPLNCGTRLGRLNLVEIGCGNRRPRVREKKTPAGVNAPAGVVQSES